MQRFTPELEKRLHRQWRRPHSASWRIDEADVKVRGKWAYLYRALDKLANTIDFYLSTTRNTKAAKRSLGKALMRIEGIRGIETTYEIPQGQANKTRRRSCARPLGADRIRNAMSPLRPSP